MFTEEGAGLCVLRSCLSWSIGFAVHGVGVLLRRWFGLGGSDTLTAAAAAAALHETLVGWNIATMKTARYNNGAMGSLWPHMARGTHSFRGQWLVTDQHGHSRA